MLVVFRAEVVSALESAMLSAMESAVCIGWAEVHLYLCVSSASVDSLGCHVGKKGIRVSGFDKASPGVLLTQPSPCYAQEAQHPASSLLGPWHVVS